MTKVLIWHCHVLLWMINTKDVQICYSVSDLKGVNTKIPIGTDANPGIQNYNEVKPDVHGK